MMYEYVAAAALLLGVVYYVANFVDKLRQYPPGPYGWPILGSLLELQADFYLKLYEITKKYGSISSFSMGQSNFVILSDPQIIRDAFNNEAFSGKPDTPLSKIFNGFGKLLFIS